MNRKMTVYEVERYFNDMASDIAETNSVDDDFYGDHWPRELQHIISLCACRGRITDEDVEAAYKILVSCL